MPTRTVAAFDFDGTLTARDTLAPFLRMVAGPAAVLAAACADAPRLLLAAAGRSSRDAAKERFLARVLGGRSHEEVAARGEEYGAGIARRGIRPAMLDRIAWHRAQGHELVIVSASLDVYLDEVGRHLGIDTVLCSRLEVAADGTCTGRLAGGNCRGPEKAQRLRAHVGAGGCRLWAYGDSAGDREMLALADHPVRVGRGPLAPVTAGA